MAFTSSSGNPMVDINVTPLVDVMLVLLIIFMIAVPALSHPIQMDLKQAVVNPIEKSDPPPPIRIHIDASGSITWNGGPMTLETLQSRFSAEAAPGISAAGEIIADKQPAVDIDADRGVEYQLVAQVMARAKNSNLVKLNFVDNSPAG